MPGQYDSWLVTRAKGREQVGFFATAVERQFRFNAVGFEKRRNKFDKFQVGVPAGGIESD
jgi:hypothetical protein